MRGSGGTGRRRWERKRGIDSIGSWSCPPSAGPAHRAGVGAAVTVGHTGRVAVAAPCRAAAVAGAGASGEGKVVGVDFGAQLRGATGAVVDGQRAGAIALAVDGRALPTAVLLELIGARGPVLAVEPVPHVQLRVGLAAGDGE